ncbi:hypothetical protein [Gordonia soli]|uniref:Uncharacterized protein n=1 Tax=Gordonia soli NBRC 108243 TaxID=1223545 RepID=M0QGB8_9ACTN|nr:hypothetical protein [Gordonia soli]GAC67628.1 hypothetical protein GS4_08_02130 [Gordonia soli NBRC 108243]
MVGSTGVVTLAIAGGDGIGEVELALAGGTERYLARSADPIEVDATVLVIGVEPGRIVDVERWLPLPG